MQITEISHKVCADEDLVLTSIPYQLRFLQPDFGYGDKHATTTCLDLFVGV